VETERLKRLLQDPALAQLYENPAPEHPAVDSALLAKATGCGQLKVSVGEVE